MCRPPLAEHTLTDSLSLLALTHIHTRSTCRRARCDRRHSHAQQPGQPAGLPFVPMLPGLGVFVLFLLLLAGRLRERYPLLTPLRTPFALSP